MTTRHGHSAAVGRHCNPRRSPSPIILALLALVVTACGRGDVGDGTALLVSVDSVDGVPHVRSAGEPQRWTLDSTLVLTDAGGEPFGRLTGVVGDWKGGVYVADAVALRVHTFGADGAYLGALGGSGTGPGRFRDMDGLAWVAGRLASLDRGNSRITLLAADGKDAPLSVRWQPPAGEVALEQTRPGEAYAPVAAPPAGEGRAGRAYIRLIGAGVPDTMPGYGAAATPAAVVACTASGQAGYFAIPFSPRPYAARAPGSRTMVGNTATYRLSFLDAAGDTVRVVEREQPALPVSDAEWANAEARWARFQEDNRSAECDAPGITRPVSKPAFRAILFDDRGRLWVEAAAADGYRLDVFDSTGALVGELPAPPRDSSVAMTIRTGRLFWVAADSAGAQTARSARIVEQSAASDSAAGS